MEHEHGGRGPTMGGKKGNEWWGREEVINYDGKMLQKPLPPGVLTYDGVQREKHKKTPWEKGGVNQVGGIVWVTVKDRKRKIASCQKKKNFSYGGGL